MISGRKLDLLARKWWIAARHRVEHFHLDERHLAHIGLRRVGAGSVEIAITFDPAASDDLGLIKLLHLQRCSLRDVNMEQAARPAHGVPPGSAGFPSMIAWIFK